MCYCTPNKRTPVCANCAQWLAEENAKLREQLAAARVNAFQAFKVANEMICELTERAEAAEAKLKELEGQEPVGLVVASTGSLNDVAMLQWVAEYRPKVGDRLYAKPVPPVDVSGGWQTIETAPRDGSYFIADYGGVSIIVSEDANDGILKDWTGSYPKIIPTRWRMLQSATPVDVQVLQKQVGYLDNEASKNADLNNRQAIRIAELERKLAEQQVRISELEFLNNLTLDERGELLLAKAREEGRKEAVPEGWQVVPRAPTHEMLVAGAKVSQESADTDGDDTIRPHYLAMLQAAPTPGER